jgi:hypothetical protein
MTRQRLVRALRITASAVCLVLGAFTVVVIVALVRLWLMLDRLPPDRPAGQEIGDDVSWLTGTLSVWGYVVLFVCTAAVFLAASAVHRNIRTTHLRLGTIRGDAKSDWSP